MILLSHVFSIISIIYAYICLYIELGFKVDTHVFYFEGVKSRYFLNSGFLEKLHVAVGLAFGGERPFLPNETPSVAESVSVTSKL